MQKELETFLYELKWPSVRNHDTRYPASPHRRDSIKHRISPTLDSFSKTKGFIYLNAEKFGHDLT